MKNQKKPAPAKVKPAVYEVEISGHVVPVRFAMRPISIYLESQDHSLTDLDRLAFHQFQDIFWISIDKGQQLTGNVVFESDEDFFDALDDDPGALSRLTEALSASFAIPGGEKADEKNG